LVTSAPQMQALMINFSIFISFILIIELVTLKYYNTITPGVQGLPASLQP